MTGAREKKDDSREKVGLHRTPFVSCPTVRKATDLGVLPADRPLGSPIFYGLVKIRNEFRILKRIEKDVFLFRLYLDTLLPFAVKQNPAESHFREIVWANWMSWSEGIGVAPLSKNDP